MKVKRKTLTLWVTERYATALREASRKAGLSDSEFAARILAKKLKILYETSRPKK